MAEMPCFDAPSSMALHRIKANRKFQEYLAQQSSKRFSRTLAVETGEFSNFQPKKVLLTSKGLTHVCYAFDELWTSFSSETHSKSSRGQSCSHCLCCNHSTAPSNGAFFPFMPTYIHAFPTLIIPLKNIEVRGPWCVWDPSTAIRVFVKSAKVEMGRAGVLWEAGIFQWWWSPRRLWSRDRAEISIYQPLFGRRDASAITSADVLCAAIGAVLAICTQHVKL